MERQSCDVIVVTVASLDGKTAESYADDYFDFNGYGLGQDRDGILLLLSMEDRDWAISTHGFALFPRYGFIFYTFSSVTLKFSTGSSMSFPGRAGVSTASATGTRRIAI